MYATESALIINQHWFRRWLGAISQQAITWANVYLDLCCHMVSLGHNQLCDLFFSNTCNSNPIKNLLKVQWSALPMIGMHGKHVLQSTSLQQATIQIWCKFNSAVIQLLVIRLPLSFAHATTAQLSTKLMFSKSFDINNLTSFSVNMLKWVIEVTPWWYHTSPKGV